MAPSSYTYTLMPSEGTLGSVRAYEGLLVAIGPCSFAGCMLAGPWPMAHGNTVMIFRRPKVFNLCGIANGISKIKFLWGPKTQDHGLSRRFTLLMCWVSYMHSGSS